jgi:hypothetical protein
MKIISHRGFWLDVDQKNSKFAFNNSFENNFGTETDIRDLNLKIVVSHDMPSDINLNIDLSQLIDIFLKKDLTLALNIKSDGLHSKVNEILKIKNYNNYFVFDMSIPDTINYINLGMNVFCRQSEYEQIVAFYEKINGIWLDSFEGIWYNKDLILNHILNNKKVCIVSSELHKRDHIILWEKILDWELILNENIILCTDYPSQAKTFFNL